MDYFRAGGVCLLLILIAAILPIGGFSATQANSGASSSSNPSVSGASPTASANSVSSSTAGQSVSQQSATQSTSTIKVQRPSSGIRPGATSASYLPSQVTTTAADTSLESSNTGKESQSTSEKSSTKVTTTTDTNAEQKTATLAPAVTTPVLKTASTNSEVSKSAASGNNAANSANSQASQVTAATNPIKVNENKAVAPSNSSNNLTASVTTTSENATSENKTAENTTTTTESPEAPKTVFTDRIWRAGISPLDYTWTPFVFSGFFYDFDDKVGTENLTVHLSSKSARSIGEHNLKYETNVQPIEFKFKDWGTYQVVGFMADKYFAGYSGTNVVDDNLSLINDGQLRKVLVDNRDEKTIVQGSVMPLEEGYELRIKEIDVNGNKVYLELAKDGKAIDSKVISPGTLKSSTYQYKVTISGEDTPIIMAHIPSVFAGTESGVVTVDGLFQVSDSYKSVEDGDKYGKMKVVAVSDSGITMDNEDSISLGKGKTVTIFGNVSFQVADADELRFAPTVERTGPYEIRGTIVDPSKTKEFTWTPYNFEGFYYDIDDDIGTESLTAKISGTSIAEGDLTYSTSPSPVKFQFKDWGKYDVIGFMADKYFAGYNNATQFADEFSDINDGELRKVLVDSKDEKTITTGSVLPLEEGYELRIKQVDINGNKVYLALAKDGKEIDSKVVSPSSGEFRTSNYLYKVTMGSEKDVPLIAAHVQSVFKGTEADLATIDGLFQLSDSPANVEEGETQGKMKVKTLTDTGITMQNDDSAVSLGRGRTVDIMGNLKFVIADNDDRNFAPVAERSGATKALDLNFTKPVVVNSTMNLHVSSAGEAISGVTVLVNGDVIGNTDATGSISYTPKSTGSIEVVARKVPYSENRTNVVVRSTAAAAEISENVTNTLSLSVPSDALKNQTFLITVTGGENQTAIENASIYFDGSAIGNTSSQGTLKYASSVLGEHEITAKASGYDKVSKNIVVMTPIQVQSFNVSSTTAKTGQTITVKANIKNIGASNDTRKMDLIANGNKTVGSQNVTLQPGENKTISLDFKPTDPGTYRLSMDTKEAVVMVEKSTTNWAMIAIILILLIAILAGAYLYQTGELDNLRKRLQKR